MEKNKSLVWIGAGSATSPKLDFDDFTNVLLVEPRKDAFLSLKNEYSDEKFSIKNNLVLPNEETRNFMTYSFEEFSSCSKPLFLKKLFPGIGIVETEQLSGIAINQLISEFNLESNFNTLVVDTPDVAKALLETLEKQNLLKLFSDIYVLYCQEELYESMPNMMELNSFLENNFYSLELNDESDPDLPIMLYTENKVARLTSQFEIEKEQLQVQISNLSSQNSELQKYSENLSTELKKQIASLQQELKNREVNEGELQIKHSAEIDSLKQKLESEQTRLENEIQGYKEAIEEAKTIATEEKSKVDGEKLILENKIKELKAEVASSSELLTQKDQQFSTEISSLKSAIKDLEITNQQLQTNLFTASEKTQQNIINRDNKIVQLESEFAEHREQKQIEIADFQQRLNEAQGALQVEKDKSQNRLESINNLKEKNNVLSKENKDLMVKQSAIENQIFKAEVQLNLLKDLLTNNNSA